MAVPDLEKIVKIIFAGDDTNLGKTITSVGGGLDALSANVSKATQPFADLSDTIIKIDAVLAGLAVGALVVATRAAGEFGDSFAEITTLIEPTTISMEDFREQILDYAKDSTQSIEDINQSLYNAISAGEDYTSALDLLAAAERLGIATKSDLNTAIGVLRPTLSAFGESTKSAADFADILFTAVKTGKLTLDELAPVLGNVASIAAQAGVPFDDLAAAIAALTATAGISASEAVTQLKGAILAIAAPTDTARAAAKQLEVAIGAEAIAAKGLDGVFRDLVEATGGNIEALKKIIPRVEGLNAVLVLGKDAAGIFDKALGAMEERAGSAAEAYDKMADNFELVNQRLINNIKAALIEVGEPLLDDWADLALSIVNILRGIEDDPINWGDVFGPLTELAEELLSDLAGYFNEIAAALPTALDGIDWSGFTGALRDLVETGKDLFGQLLGGLDLTKPADLEKAIQKVIDTFQNWVKLTEGLVQGIAPFLVKLAELASKFSELDEEGVKFFGQITGWGKSINLIAETVPKLTGALNLLSGAIGLLSVTRIPGMISALGAAGLGGALTGLVGAGGALTLFAGAIALIPDTKLNVWLKENSDAFNTLAPGVENAWLKMRGIDTTQIDNLKTSGEQKKLLGELALAVNNWANQLSGVPAEVDTSIQIVDVMALQAQFDLITGKIKEIDESEADVKVGAAFKEGEIEKLESDWNTIKVTLEDGTVTEIRVNSDQAVADAKDASDKIDKELADKLIEIKLQGEIDIELANIRAQAETLQTAFEWQAKVEIADIEAAAKELEAIAGTIEAAWQATADVISSALGVLTGFEAGTREWRDILRIIDREQTLQEAIWETQKLLIEEQTKLIEARTKAIAEGKGIITITTDGLEPELEQVLYSIVQKAQIKANEEGFNTLLGI
jgi:TP901 family phage tail tape measure protein